MNTTVTTLFEGRLVDLLSRRRRDATTEVAEQAPVELIAAAPDHLLAYLLHRHGTAPLHLASQPQVGQWLSRRGDRAGNTIHEREVLAVELPFAGDPELFQCRPDGAYPSGIAARVEAGRGCVAFEIPLDDRDPARAWAAIEAVLRPLREVVETQARQIRADRVDLERELRDRIEARRRDLQSQREFIAGLGLGVSDLPDPGRAVGPAVSRTLELKSVAPAADSWRLSAENFEAILETLRHMSLVIERCPRAFAGMGEEDLRMHFLVHLNAVFRGAATGETFNRTGKTDILLRHEGQNLFIAECKFWKGKTQFAETVEQLLGYLTWRDSRAAVLVFVRGVAMTTVLDRIDEVLRGDDRSVEVRSDPARPGEYRVQFRRPSDPDSLVHIAVQCYEVGAAE